MALTSPNTLGGRDRIEDLLAHLVDGQTDFDNIGSTSALGKAYLDAIEMALDFISTETGFQYYERQSDLNVLALYSAGDVDVTQDSATITSDNGSTDWSTGTPVNAGRAHFRDSASDGGILVTAVGAAQSATLGQAYIGSTATNLSYEIVNDDYDLDAGVWQLLTFREINPDVRPLQIITHGEWLNRTGGIWQTGRPEYAVVLGHDPSASGASGTAYRIRLWPSPDVRYQYEYTYRTVPTFPATGATFESSPASQSLLVWRAAAYLFGDRGEIERSEHYLKRYNTEIKNYRRVDARREVGSATTLMPWWSIEPGRLLRPDQIQDTD